MKSATIVAKREHATGATIVLQLPRGRKGKRKRIIFVYGRTP